MRINPLGFVRLIPMRINPLGEGLTEQDLREGLTEQGLNELLEFNLCEIFKWSKETPHIYTHFIPSYDYNLSCSYPRIRTLCHIYGEAFVLFFAKDVKFSVPKKCMIKFC